MATNSEELIDAVRERCGVGVEVISGEQEARLAYLAATSELDVGKGTLAVFDTEMKERLQRNAALERDLRLALSRNEFVVFYQPQLELLAYLLRHKGEVVTRAMLGRDVWKEPAFDLTNVIDVYITLLRRKVEKPGQRPLIHTLRGVGYSLRG